MEDEDPSTERRGLGLDPTPLLHQLIRTSRRTNNPTTPSYPSNNRSRFSLFISRATNRTRIISEPSSMFRRDSTVGLDGQQNDNWGYSKPVVILDVIWNLAFVLVSSVVLSSTISENPATPLRVWIVGYAIQCLFHVGFVYFEYQRRISIVIGGDDGENQRNQLLLSSENRSRRYKWMESMNTLVSFFWWVIGFYWIVAGGQALLLDAPRLYWLAVVFLAFDVFFAIFCIALACIIGVALCCCLPCIVAILYAVAVQEGASEDDINVLPRHKFRQMNQHEKSNAENRQEVVPVAIMEQSTCNIISELSLPPEDSECCICLSQYVDGVELHSLPCNHHFHSGCIVKWLRINATCPLCKLNILHGDELV